MASEKLTPLQSRRYAAQEKFRGGLSSSIPHGTPIEVAARQKAFFSSVETSYANKVFEYKVGLYTLKAGSFIVDGLLSGVAVAGLVAAPVTGGASLLSSGAMLGLSKVDDIALAAFQKAGQEQISQLLKGKLQEFDQQQIKDLQATWDADPGSPATLERLVSGPLSPIINDALGFVGEEQKPIVEAFYRKQLAVSISQLGAGVAQGFASLAEGQKVTQDEIRGLRTDVSALGNSLFEFRKETNAKLSEVVQTQKEIQQGLADLSDQVAANQAKNEKDIGFIHDFMYSRMTPGEQLAALKAGMFDLLPKERETRKKQVELVLKRQELDQKMTGFVSSLGSLAQIAGNLGLNPKLTKTLSVAAKVGGTGLQALQAFSTGNFLAGIAAISGLFGGGPDIAEQRHKEVMDALGTIYEAVGMLGEAIAQIGQNLEQVFKLQQATYQAVVQLSEQVWLQHREVMTELKYIHEDVLRIAATLDANEKKHYAFCDDILFDDERVLRIDVKSGKFPEYNHLKQLVENEFAPKYLDAREVLLEVRTGDGSFLPKFDMSISETPGNPVKLLRDNVYAPLVELVITNGMSLEQKGGVFLNLMTPAIKLSFMRSKVTASADLKPDPKVVRDLHAKGLRGLFELMSGNKLLHAETVLMHSEYLCNFHWLMQVAPGNDAKVLERSDILSGKNLGRSGRIALREAIALLNITIAQQALLSGDVALPLIYQDITKTFSLSNNEDRLKKLGVWCRVFELSPAIAKNFALYLVNEELIQRGLSNAAWQFAVESKRIEDRSGLSTCLVQHPGDGWRLEVKNSRSDPSIKVWVIVLVGTDSVNAGVSHDLELPSAADLRADRLVVQPDVPQLLVMRSALEEELDGYEVMEMLSENESAVLDEIVGI